MAAIKFFDFPLAYNPAKARLALVEKCVPFKTHTINILGGDALDPWFLKLNPNSTLPVITAGDRVMVESREIVHFVDTYGGTSPLGASVDRSSVTSWVDKINAWDGNVWAFANSDPGTLSFLKGANTYKIKYAEARMKEHPELAALYDAKIASIRAEPTPEVVKSNDDVMTDILVNADLALKGQEFLAGPQYTIADVMLTVLLWRIEKIGNRRADVIDPKPNVSKYFDRVKARPSYAQALEVAGGLTLLGLIAPTLLKQKLAAFTGRY